MLDGPTPTVEYTAIDGASPPTGELLNVVHARMADELNAESDRRRAVEAKLVAAAAVGPIAVTLIAALVTFLTSGRAGSFSRPSVITLALIGLYVALQFVWTTLEAVRGLRRTSYDAGQISDLICDNSQNKDAYLFTHVTNLARRIEQHRYATNNRVDQLALAHDAMLNGVWGLVFAIAVLVFVTVFG